MRTPRLLRLRGTVRAQLHSTWGAPRKNLVGVSSGGLDKGWWLSQLISIIDNAFPQPIVELTNTLAADACQNHAEQKVVRAADGEWEILGIGASQTICEPCQAAIRENSPAAIMVPTGASASCKTQ